MDVVIWITEGTWPACVDAARVRSLEDEEPVLLHVTDDTVAEPAHGALAVAPEGGPARAGEPGARVEQPPGPAVGALLDAAADRLGRPAERRIRHGRVAHEVVREAHDAELLICARDGDRSRLGPDSLGPVTRFVVDHAPCPVLLVWPGPVPGLESLPPAPPP